MNLLRTPRRQGALPERVSLVFGILAGLVLSVLALSEFNTEAELDFHAYYFAGQAIARGEPFVGFAITDGTLLTDKAYVYTPITGPLFIPYGLFPDWWVAYALNGLILLGTLIAIAILSIQFIERHGRSLARIDKVLIYGFCVVSTPAVLGLYRGNIDPLIAVMLVGGFLAVQRGREAVGGSIFALAALFKLFPAILGVWLVYRRSYRAIATALAVGVGATMLGLLVFGLDVYIEYAEFILTERSRAGAFEGGLDPTSRWITLRRPLSQVLPLAGNGLMVLSLLVMMPFLYLIYRRADSALDQLGVFTATLIVILVTIVPATAGYVVYLVFPLVVLVYLVDHRRAKQFLLAGVVLISMPIYPQYIEQGLGYSGLPPRMVEAGTDIAFGVLSVSSVGLLGFLAAFVGCFLYVCVPDGEHDA